MKYIFICTKVSLVINYDIPVTTEKGDVVPDYSTYLHRIGRTARFDRAGIALNFVHDTQSKRFLRQIEGYFGREIKRFPLEDVERLGEELNRILDSNNKATIKNK